MRGNGANGSSGKSRALWLWAPWLLGPLGWALHQSASFASTEWICATGNYSVLYLFSVIALSVSASGLTIAWHRFRMSGRGQPGSATRTRSPERFMALAGIMICTLSLVGIVVESFPGFLADACARAT